MAKSFFSDYDTTNANNTDVGGVPIAGTNNISNFDNGLRELLTHIAEHFAMDTIASGATCDLGSKAAHYLQITGTTTITSFGTVKAGTLKFIEFAGILTLTHNATSLIIPGGANKTTAAGDTAIVVSEGSGNWRCLVYVPAAAGTTYLAASNNLSDLASAATARTNLALVPGTNVQAFMASASQAEMEAGTETSLRAMTPQRVAQAIAALGADPVSTTYGAVGTYVVAYYDPGGGITENTTYAGSSLEPAGFTVGVFSDDGSGSANGTKGGAALSGTWRSMGRANAGTRQITLFVRTV